MKDYIKAASVFAAVGFAIIAAGQVSQRFDEQERSAALQDCMTNSHTDTDVENKALYNLTDREYCALVLENDDPREHSAEVYR